MDKLVVDDLEVTGKKVLVRVDFNVPLNAQKQITDDTRIQAALPTLNTLLDRGAALIIMSHLGRPKGQMKPDLSLAPCGQRLSELLERPVILATGCVDQETHARAAQLQAGEVMLLENLRFHAAEEDPESDPSFAAALASLGDIYVNDAFGTAHRRHSSTAVIAEHFPQTSAAGYLLQREIEYLDGALKSPQRPFWAILGGAKVSSKLGVIHSLLDKVDGLIIGGAMAFTFLKAQGYAVGESLWEPSLLDDASSVLRRCQEEEIPLLLPSDFLCARQLSAEAKPQVYQISDGIPEGKAGFDIGPDAVARIQSHLQTAQTVLWNGPLGVFEFPPFARGTLNTAQTLAELRATTIVGGGDSVAAVKQAKLEREFSHLSTGGGAALEYIELGMLPGIEALSPKRVATSS
jgi:phosphoglycerate kinase